MFEWEKLLQSNWELLAANYQINRRSTVLTKMTQGVVCPCHGAIYMYMTIVFKHL